MNIPDQSGGVFVKKMIVFTLIIVCLFSMTACGQAKEERKDIEDIIVNRTFVYEKEGFGGEFTIQINDDGTFGYYEGLLSSYIGMGSWIVDNDILVLSDDGGMGYPLVNRFEVKDGDLVFLSEDSSNFMYVHVEIGRASCRERVSA